MDAEVRGYVLPRTPEIIDMLAPAPPFVSAPVATVRSEPLLLKDDEEPPAYPITHLPPLATVRAWRTKTDEPAGISIGIGSETTSPPFGTDTDVCPFHVT
jgi:hypothetical protein